MPDIDLPTETERELYISSLSLCVAKGRVTAAKAVDEIRALANGEFSAPLSSDDEALLEDYLGSLPPIETVDPAHEGPEIEEIAAILKSALTGGNGFRNLIGRSAFTKT